MSKRRLIDTEVSHGDFTVTHDARSDCVKVVYHNHGPLGFEGIHWFCPLNLTDQQVHDLLRCLQDLLTPDAAQEAVPQ